MPSEWSSNDITRGPALVSVPEHLSCLHQNSSPCLYDDRVRCVHSAIMPIFQDDIGTGASTPPDRPGIPVASSDGGSAMRRQLSEESIRTELCEGLVLETTSGAENSSSPVSSPNGAPTHATSVASDRVGFIERLKRGQNSTWLSNQDVRRPFVFQPSKLQYRMLTLETRPSLYFKAIKLNSRPEICRHNQPVPNNLRLLLRQQI